MELFRIVVMLLIVAHHYVVNSEVFHLMKTGDIDAHSVFFNIFGAWGKTGINCFVLITGYFMCKSQITLRKFMKLYLEIKFYHYAIWAIFFSFGMSTFSWKTLVGILPFTKIGTSFTNAFMAFYLLIPFLNILVKNLTKNQHLLLMGLLLWIYTGLGMLQMITFNYVSWFSILFVISSYIRFYGLPHNNNTRYWAYITLILFILSIMSIFCTILIGMRPTYFFVSDSNSILAVLLAVASFMFFKNLKIGYSKWINIIGSTTFGVFLIHTRGNEMRQWLWYDIVDCGGHYSDSYYWLYAIVVVLSIFIICSLIDWIRMNFLEKWMFRVIDPLITRVGKLELIRYNDK